MLEMTYTEEEYSILTNPYHWWNEWWDCLAEYAKLAQMNIDDIVSRCWNEFDNCNGKYARVARVYMPILQPLIDLDWRAKDLYRTLALEQTQPLNELQRQYGYFDIEGEVEYREVDSYTGEIIEDDDHALAGKVAPAIWHDELAERIAEEYPEALRGRALEASRGGYYPLEIESELFTIDAGIASEPISQMMYNELRIDPADWYDAYNKAKPAISKFNERRSEWFAQWRDKKPWQFGITWDDWAVFKIMKFRAEVAKWDERNLFLESLQWLANKGFEPQYIGKLFLILQNDEWGLDWDDSKLIKLPYWQEAVPISNPYSSLLSSPPTEEQTRNDIPEDWSRLDRFLDLYEDYILEEDGTGRTRSGMSEYEILQAADKLEMEYLSSLPETSDNHRNAEGTRPFMQGMLSAITEPNQMKSAGYAQWRTQKFPQGDIAFNTVLMQTGNYSKAWTSFYNTAEIRAVGDTVIEIYKPMKDVTERISWGLARYRAKMNELYVQPDKLDKFRTLAKGKLSI